MACTPCFTRAERLKPCQNLFPVSDCNCKEECTHKVKEYAEMHYEPIATTVTCKESKSSKRSLWQRLFGGLSQKRQDCSCKEKIKEKCLPVVNENITCKPHPLVKRQFCKPGCRCRPKPYVCPRSGCYATPKSVCGCHFYINIENRPRGNWGNPGARGCSTVVNKIHKDTLNTDNTKEYTYDIREEPVHDDAVENIRVSPMKEINPPVDNKLTNHTRYSSLYKGRRTLSAEEKMTKNSRHSSVTTRKSTSPEKYSYTARHSGLLVKESIKSNVEIPQTYLVENTTDCDEGNDIRIGLTFTKEETTYYKKNNNICNSSLKKCESPESYTNTTTDHIISDFQKSKGKLSASSCDDRVQHGRQTEQSIVEEYLSTEGLHSESLSREIIPLFKKRKEHTETERGSEQHAQKEPPDMCKTTKYDSRNTSFKTPLASIVPTTHRRCSNTDLDRRVSEILRKLENIEEKMICISCGEKNGKNNEDSLCGKVNCVRRNLRCSDNEKENYYSSDICKKDIRTSNAIIEISQIKSRTQYPPTVCTTSEIEALNRSLSLNMITKNKISKANITIKIPNADNSKQQCITFPISNSCTKLSNCLSVKHCMPTNNYRQSEINNDGSRVTWCQVSNALKTRPPLSCYCYDCVCKRNAASP